VCRCFSKLDGAVDAYAIGIRVDRDKVGLHVFRFFRGTRNPQRHCWWRVLPYSYPHWPAGKFLEARPEVGEAGIVARVKFPWGWLMDKVLQRTHTVNGTIVLWCSEPLD
jgi:hypothetical protein